MTDRTRCRITGKVTTISQALQPAVNGESAESRRLCRHPKGSADRLAHTSSATFPVIEKSAASACRPLASPAPVPIWLAALMATRCRAEGNGESHAIGWYCDAGRAIYTNSGVATERIEPLGISLHRGETLEVYWRPGETAYTMEISGWANRPCA